jgi:hypothetical protein
MGPRGWTAVAAVTSATVLTIGLVGTAVVGPSGNEEPVTAAAGGQEKPTGTAERTEPEPTEGAPQGGSASPKEPLGQAAATASTTAQQLTVPVQAAADGTYRRRVDWTWEKPTHGKGGGETATRVSTTARSAAEVQQHHETTWTSTDNEKDGRPAAGIGPSDVRWTGQGMYRAQGSGGNGSRSCDPAETLQLQLPLAAGARWTTTAVCNYERQGGGRTTSRIETVSEVVGGREVNVAGKSMAVWEIVAESRTRADGQSEGSTTKTTMLFSPELGVDVRTDSTTTVLMLGYTVTTQLVDIVLD